MTHDFSRDTRLSRAAAIAGFVNAASRATAAAVVAVTPFWYFYGVGELQIGGAQFAARPFLVGILVVLSAAMFLSSAPFAVGLAKAFNAPRRIVWGGALLLVAASLIRAAVDLGSLAAARDLAALAVSGRGSAAGWVGAILAGNALANLTLAGGLALLAWAMAKDGRFARWLLWLGGGAAWFVFLASLSNFYLPLRAAGSFGLAFTATWLIGVSAQLWGMRKTPS